MNWDYPVEVRLQKLIAASGVASRRKAEELIRDGHVMVNGQVVREMGTCADPEKDHVRVNGRRININIPEVFVILNKPPGYVTSTRDPLERPTIYDLLGRVKVRVFPVGRLDFDSEGLLLLTNNGRIAQACLHPKFHVAKTYLVKVSGVLLDEEIKTLEKGVVLDDGPTAPAIIKKSGKAKVNSWIEITIHEGRTRQVKRMIEAVGHRVARLRRIRFGPLHLGDLSLGSFRYATDSEANGLRRLLERRPRTASHKAEQPLRVREKRHLPEQKTRYTPATHSKAKTPKSRSLKKGLGRGTRVSSQSKGRTSTTLKRSRSSYS